MIAVASSPRSRPRTRAHPLGSLGLALAAASSSSLSSITSSSAPGTPADTEPYHVYPYSCATSYPPFSASVPTASTSTAVFTNHHGVTSAFTQTQMHRPLSVYPPTPTDEPSEPDAFARYAASHGFTSSMPAAVYTLPTLGTGGKGAQEGTIRIVGGGHEAQESPTT